MTHDPSEYIRGLQQLLVSDKKKIAFLFGAGTSLAKKNDDSKNVPGIKDITNEVEEKLSKKPKYKKAIIEIKDEIGIEKFTIESLLSNLEQKKQVIGNGKLNGLKKENFDELIKKIKLNIRQIVSIHKNLDINNVIQADFAEWIGKADRKYPIEIFTTNYDYLFEIGLEQKNIPFYDGFTGSYNPFFNAESVDDLCFLPKQTKLWKIHGSLGWHFDKETKKVIRKDSDSDDFLIYPSILKYDESRKQPYLALGDRLTNFLKQPDTILITCGYSFNDYHINERIFTALKSELSAHVYALYYDILENSKLRKKKYGLTPESTIAKIAKSNSKISALGCRNAVIGSQFGKWKLKKEPDKDDAINIDLYFGADGPTDISDPLEEEKNGDEKWTGEGELKISDFKFFVKFLQSMIFTSTSIKVTNK